MVLLGIVDDAQPGFISYSGSQWTHSNRPSYYNRTITECQAPPQGTTLPPSLSFSFYGTTVNLFGGPVANNMEFSYSIDGAVLSNANINFNAFGKISAELWSLTGLSSSIEHTLKIVPTAGLFSLDYITFTPTTLTTQVTRNLNVVYDDADLNALQYSGTWNNTLSAIPGGVPYEGTRTGSSTQGNTMKLNFIGSSITVNGLLNQGPGSLSASFSVDGGKATTFSPFNGSQQVNTSSWAFAQPFFHEDLSPGVHSLLVTVQQATESQVLWLDSVVFGATTNTSITSVPNNTGNGTSSGGPGKKIIGIAAGVFGFLILAAIISRNGVQRRKRYHPPPVVEQPPTFTTQETRIPIPQRPIYEPYTPRPQQNFAYGSEMSLNDIYPTANHVRNPSPPPSQRYYPPPPPPPRTTYTAPPQQVEDGVDFAHRSRSRPARVDDGVDFELPRWWHGGDGDGLSSSQVQLEAQAQAQGRNMNTNATSPPSSATANPATPPRRRPPSPQQDGSDGPLLQQQPQHSFASVSASDQLDGSESFTQIKPNTTVLTYHPASQTQTAGPSHHQDGGGTAHRMVENEQDDEPPPYNP